MLLSCLGCLLDFAGSLRPALCQATLLLFKQLSNLVRPRACGFLQKLVLQQAGGVCRVTALCMGCMASG